MKIDKSNYKFINPKEIYIHDSIFNDIVSDYQKKHFMFLFKINIK